MLYPGDLLANKLRIVRRLGAGGMGVVYEAVQVHLGRRVAVKVIRADESRSPEAQKRFMREARAQALLPTEHIGQVLDVDSLPDGNLYTVMEYLDGRDLKRELKKRGPLPLDEAAAYLIQACEGAAAAHAAGIVHRDLKPQNLFLTNLGGKRKIKVLDFGIAKFLQGLRQDLTGSDRMVGTPTHLSPEQVAGGEIDGRADVWSLGIVLFELLTGETPFRRDTALGTIAAIANEPTPPLTRFRPEAPSELAAVIEKCLAKRPDERFQTAAELADALAPFAASFSGVVPPALQSPRGSSMPAAPNTPDPDSLPVIVPPAPPLPVITSKTATLHRPSITKDEVTTAPDIPALMPARVPATPRRFGARHLGLVAVLSVGASVAYSALQARGAAAPVEAPSVSPLSPASVAPPPLAETTPARGATTGAAPSPPQAPTESGSETREASPPRPKRAKPAKSPSITGSTSPQPAAPPTGAVAGDAVPIHL
jgi:serine/threonine protein kinase